MCRALEFSIPEQEAWTEEAQHDLEFNREWYGERMAGLDRLRAIAEPYINDEEEFFEPWEREALPPPFDTIVRDSPMVGRNDPCTCGSGKKFKKCCLNKASNA